MRENLNSNDWFKIGKEYLDLGWSIIPVNDSKKPLYSWKVYQNKLATTEQLKQWSTNPALAGFALVTGKLSGVFVLDIDEGSTFDTNNLPKTAFSKTGSGGSHFFFLFQNSDQLRNSGGFQPHTDTRGEGGYAILPPSKHQSGNHYEWVSDPFSTPLASIPASLAKKLQNPIKNEKSVDTKSSIFQGVAESKRNDSATRVIGKLLRQFDQKDWDTEVWSLIQAWNKNNNPPLGETELVTTFNSIKKKALEQTESVRSGGQVAQILKLVKKNKLEVFLNQFREPFITTTEKKFIAQPIKSENTDSLLFKIYWQEFGKSPSTNAIKEAKNTLRGIATYDNPVIKEVHNRICWYGDSIYYDIGDDIHVVKISADGWKITTNCPIVFRRYKHQQIQALPQTGGSLTDFSKLVNVSDENSNLLLLTNLVVGFIPNIPRAILALNGDPGSAKSTLMKQMRSIIDPSAVPLLTPPRKISELAQISSHNYVVYFDNLSGIPEWLSDTMCRIVTGEGFSKRELFSDDDDVLYSFMRVVGFCGINQVAAKADLIDRCVIIALDPITNDKRKEEATIWGEFNEVKPKLLGDVFNCLSYCLRTVPTLEISSLPRMADYFRYAVAASQFLGYEQDALQLAFTANIANQHDEAIEASPVASVVIHFMEKRQFWDGTSSEFYQEALDVAEELKIKSKFPKSPNWLWRKINEVKTNLLAYGIKLERYKATQANRIKILKIDTSLKENEEQLTSGSMEVMEAEIPF